MLIPGARVRITGSSERGAQPGTIVSADSDTVTLKLDTNDRTVAFSRAGITRVEASRGLHGHTGAGIGIGFVAGFGVGAVVGYHSCGTCGGGEDDQMSKMFEALAWGAILGGAGMLVGGVIGAHHKTDRWEELPPSQWRLSVVPGRSRLVVALSRSW